VRTHAFYAASSTQHPRRHYPHYTRAGLDVRHAATAAPRRQA